MIDLLPYARGDAPCDLLIAGGRVANVFSLEYEEADIAIHGGLIVGVGHGYRGVCEVDASGKILIPGMIDAHLHIESTMLTPSAFAQAVTPRGTTTIFPDPHEIANSLGSRGVEFMWKDALRTPLDVFYAAPSCVPASRFETAYRDIDAHETAEWINMGWCGHLGEMMNFPGVIYGDDAVWDKIASARYIVKTAHLPGVRGKDLNAYLMSGCDGDHESGSVDEALEKLRRGVWVMMREGATEHNLEDLIALVIEDESRYARCMAVSDDLTADYILSNGHMDHKVRMMIERGVRPLVALAMATINPADYFRMWDRGAIAPGRIADIVMVTSLDECVALKVWKRGALVAENGISLFGVQSSSFEVPRAPKLEMEFTEDIFRVTPLPGKKIRVMEARPNVVVTGELITEPAVSNGFVISDTGRDILKMAVVEKNRGSGRTGIGFVRGFGLKRGAIASSVAHDAHNYSCVGVDDESMSTAFEYLAKNSGGLVVTDGAEVLASLALPIGGLMSDSSPEELARATSRMLEASRSLGCAMPQPFMTMSFLSLSVVPELKLTDQGYVNAAENRLVELFV